MSATFQKIPFLILALLCCIETQSFANDEIIRSFRSYRAYGMGGTFVTTGDYADALFGNPARHVAVDEGKVSVLDIYADTNYNFISSIDDFSNIKGSGTSAISSIAPLAGKHLHGRFSLLVAGYSPHFIDENLGFSFGVLFNFQTNILPHVDTTIDSQSYGDFGPHVGVAYKFLDGDLMIGLNSHLVYRVAADRRINAFELLINNKSITTKSLGAEGLGLDLDLGAYYKLPLDWETMHISVGANFSNLLMSTYTLANGKYVAKEGLLHPPRNDRTLGLGVRMDFPDLWIFKNNLFALEMLDIGSTLARTSIAKRFHMGGETRLIKRLFFRAGLNSGYITAGLGFNFPVLKIDLATWGEELGPNAGTKQDRRFGLKLAVDL